MRWRVLTLNERGRVRATPISAILVAAAIAIGAVVKSVISRRTAEIDQG